VTRPLRLVVAAVLATAAAILTVAAAWPSHSDAGPTRFDARTATESALAGLMADYNPVDGRFATDPTAAWWQSAAALDVVVRAEQALGSHAYDGDLIHSYETNLDAKVLHIQGYRTNNYDDSGWWALLWLDAYQQTGDKAMLATAEDLDDYLASGWTAGPVGSRALRTSRPTRSPSSRRSWRSQWWCTYTSRPSASPLAWACRRCRTTSRTGASHSPDWPTPSGWAGSGGPGHRHSPLARTPWIRHGTGRGWVPPHWSRQVCRDPLVRRVGAPLRRADRARRDARPRRKGDR
jgi:hypothetical protein